MQNSIHINQSKMEVKWKDYYWNIIDDISYLPKGISPWEKIYIIKKKR